MLRSAVLVVAACGGGPAANPPPVSHPQPPSPPAMVKPAAPTASAPCRVAKGTQGPDAWESLAACPDPTSMVRGDGVASTDQPPVVPSAMPPWDLEASRGFACAYACPESGATAHLLAWSVVEDDRPLRNHNAAFLIEEPGANKWTVVVMYRHATNSAWNINASFHRPKERPIVAFDHRPTAAEVEAVLAAVRWQYSDEPAGGFQVLAGNMLDDVWRAQAGGAPSQHHPERVER